MDKWTQWLSAVPTEEQKSLFSLLKTRYEPSNGHHPQQDTNDVLVTRTEAEDLLVIDPPPYVDIFRLHDFYEKVAFTNNLLLKGPKGDGKSLSIFTYAAKKGIPLVVQECSEGTKESHLFGSQTLLGDRTIFVLGSIPTAIDIANEVGECILLFEELSALTPQVQKMLNAIGDFRKACSLPSIKRTFHLEKGKKLWPVGTLNPSVYGGTYDLNEDLKSRYDELELTYPDPGLEKTVILANCGNKVADDVLNKVIRLGSETRAGTYSYKLSTRDLVRMVDTISKTGLPIALQLIVGKFEGEDRKNALIRIKSIFGDTGIKEFWS
jgi:hypothetical protein